MLRLDCEEINRYFDALFKRQSLHKFYGDEEGKYQEIIEKHENNVEYKDAELLYSLDYISDQIEELDKKVSRIKQEFLTPEEKEKDLLNLESIFKKIRIKRIMEILTSYLKNECDGDFIPASRLDVIAEEIEKALFEKTNTKIIDLGRK